MTWLPAPAGVLAFDRGDVACVANLSPAPVELPAHTAVLLASGPLRRRPAPPGHRRLAADPAQTVTAAVRAKISVSRVNGRNSRSDIDDDLGVVRHVTLQAPVRRIDEFLVDLETSGPAAQAPGRQQSSCRSRRRDR